MKVERLHAIGLGSNIEPRQQFLEAAVMAIDALPHSAVLATSQLWLSKGWGRDDLEPFLNAVLVLRSALEPHELLAELRRIEDAHGRQRTIKWGPRTLDLDLLASDDIRIRDEVLEIPHPWAARRPFVYLPWRELQGFHPAWPALIANNPPEAKAEEPDSTPLSVDSPLWGIRRMASPIMTFRCVAEDDTLALARGLGSSLRAGDLIFLEGRMGAGKSVVARGIARGLKIDGPIQSPTYTLCRRYEEGRLPFEHWDLYRLSSAEDLASCGYDPPDPSAVRVVEWASQFPRDAGRPNLEITLTVEPDDARAVTIKATRHALPFAVRVRGESAEVRP
ncbi:2-amino-4-hydroxy-6-hydroxymethyldihydropteridine diphosphokinase [bacterium]|nr:2-amino-4-hydroxy-6-hydroxymethyldihydropteridine diphosphokinase [bacterium]